MGEARGTVRGPRNAHGVSFYGLSTCVWCKRTRAFLEENGVAFDFAYVDLLTGGEQRDVLDEVKRWNPASSFPVIVVDGTTCVVGYQPDRMKEVLGL